MLGPLPLIQGESRWCSLVPSLEGCGQSPSSVLGLLASPEPLRPCPALFLCTPASLSSVLVLESPFLVSVFPTFIISLGLCLLSVSPCLDSQPVSPNFSASLSVPLLFSLLPISLCVSISTIFLCCLSWPLPLHPTSLSVFQFLSWILWQARGEYGASEPSTAFLFTAFLILSASLPACPPSLQQQGPAQVAASPSGGTQAIFLHLAPGLLAACFSSLSRVGDIKTQSASQKQGHSPA